MPAHTDTVEILYRELAKEIQSHPIWIPSLGVEFRFEDGQRRNPKEKLLLGKVANHLAPNVKDDKN